MRAATILTIVLLLIMPTFPGGAETPGGHRVDAASAGPPTLGTLLAGYEANVGQWSDSVTFVARAPGYRAAFLPDRVGLTLPTATTAPVPGRGPGAFPADEGAPVAALPGAIVPVSLTFPTASALPSPVAGERLPGRIHHLNGADPAAWVRDAPLHRTLTLPGIAPGIDVAFRTTDTGLIQFDFILAPGADPSLARFAFPDADAFRLADDGALHVEKRGEHLHVSPPVVYELDASGRHIPIEVAFVLDGDIIGFALGPRDPSRILVIDPVISRAMYSGGSLVDAAQAVTVDALGNPILTGMTQSPDYPTQGSAHSSGTGKVQAILLKMDAATGALDFATYLGGEGHDFGMDVAVDASGHIALAGYTNSTDFPLVAAGQSIPGGFYDAFAMRLTPDGASIITSTYAGGNGDDFTFAVATAPDGTLHLAGATASTDLPALGGFQAVRPGNSDGFITTVAPDGSIARSTYLGGALHADFVADLAVAADGTLLVVGSTMAPDFPATSGAWSPTKGALSDGFAARLSPDLSTLLFATFIRGGSNDLASAIAEGPGGLIYVGGATTSPDLATSPDAFQPVIRGQGDGYVLALESDGSDMRHGTRLGGSRYEYVRGLAVDGVGAVHVTGYTMSSNFPTKGSLQPLRGVTDAFVVRLQADLTDIDYSALVGGSGSDYGNGIAVDANRIVTIVGHSSSTNHPTVGGPTSTHSGGVYDATLVRFLPPVATRITADPILGDGAGVRAPTFSALLEEEATGIPIAGRLVGFYADRDLACVAHTNATGIAQCGPLDAADGIAATGYRVWFFGDVGYLASEDVAGLYRLLGEDVPP